MAAYGAAVLEQSAHQRAAVDVATEQSAEQFAAVMLLAERLDLRDAGNARHSETVGRLARRAGASGDEIPLAEGIVAVADAREAMIADRPYRAVLGPAKTGDELRAGASARLDARVVGAFPHTLGAPERPGHTLVGSAA